jgi:hypothetical protein
MNPKFFNVEEAERLIGFLEGTLERIKRNKQQFLWLLAEISVLKLIVSCGAGRNNPDAVELRKKTMMSRKLAREIEKDISAINETGCLLRDAERGIVDFYSMKNDSVVFLCWKKGEDSIKFWHPIHEGYAGRQPLIKSSSR